MDEQIQVRLNGEPKRVPADWNLLDLIDELELTKSQVAAEVNRRIVRRSDWQQCALDRGDEIEIVHFVGGGER